MFLQLCSIQSVKNVMGKLFSLHFYTYNHCKSLHWWILSLSPFNKPDVGRCQLTLIINLEAKCNTLVWAPKRSSFPSHYLFRNYNSARVRLKNYLLHHSAGISQTLLAPIGTPVSQNLSLTLFLFNIYVEKISPEAGLKLQDVLQHESQRPISFGSSGVTVLYIMFSWARCLMAAWWMTWCLSLCTGKVEDKARLTWEIRSDSLGRSKLFLNWQGSPLF